MRDYGRIHCAYWTSGDIQPLTDRAKLLGAYLLTCAHGTIAGAFRLPIGYVADDLRWSCETVTEGFDGRDLDAPAMRFEDFGRAALMKTAFASSPVAAVSTWRSPVLIVHGDDDRNVPVAQSIDLIARLDSARVPHEEIILANEIHSFLLHESAVRVDQAVARFFDERL